VSKAIEFVRQGVAKTQLFSASYQ